MARSLALLLAAVAAACSWSGPRITPVDPDQWKAIVESERNSPTAVFVWAVWSRRAVELLPTIVEFERAYAPRGVRFITVCLHDPDDEVAHGAALELVERFGARFPHYRLEADYFTAAEVLGAASPPALVLHRADSKAALVLEGDEESGTPLAAAEIADALEALAPSADPS